LAIAGLLAAAGGLHLAALPAHVAESVAAGVFFAAAALGQFVGAVLVARGPSRRTAVAVIVANLLVLFIWAASRTTGLPTGDGIGAREPLTLLDGLAAAAEILIVAGGLAIVARPSTAKVRRWSGWPLGLALAVTWLVSGALATGLAVPHRHHHQDPHHHASQTGARATPASSDGPIPPADQPSPVPPPAFDPGPVDGDIDRDSDTQPCPNVHSCDPDHHHGL
jgi:hypothetical protein